MPGATPLHAIPYVQPADLRSQLPTTDADARARIEYLLAHLDEFVPYTNGSSTSPFTAATNFTVNSGNYALWGPFVHLYGYFVRTTTAIAAVATGDIGNTTVATITPGRGIRLPANNAASGTVYGGPLYNLMITTAGIVQVQSLPPNLGWAIGAYCACHFFYCSDSAPT